LRFRSGVEAWGVVGVGREYACEIGKLMEMGLWVVSVDIVRT